jgi:putative phosphoribosyl transferase
MNSKLKNRMEGGKLLAKKLTIYANREDVLILALPRGGVPVAFEIAQFLNLNLDICLVRKVGVPHQKELAMGAIAMGNIVVFNEDILHSLNISKETFNQVKEIEAQELNRREKKYRGDKPFPSLENKTIILVDDGIATGATLEAAIRSIKQQKPAQIIIAVPVAPPSICHYLERQVDQLICLLKPEVFSSISLWYDDFSQTTDQEVCELLAKI